jgi:hypothetical protein
VASPTLIIPDELFDRTRQGEAIEFLKALPIPAEDKVDLLAGYALWLGIRFNASQIERVRQTGNDLTPWGV